MRAIVKAVQQGAAFVTKDTPVPAPTTAVNQFSSAQAIAAGSGAGWRALGGYGAPGSPARVSRGINTYGGTDTSSSLVFSCTTVIADTLAGYPYYIADVQGDAVEPSPADQQLHDLMAQPDRSLTYFDWVADVETDLQLVGNSYWLMDEQNALGQPLALRRFMPGQVKVATNNNDEKIGYVVNIKGVDIAYGVDEIIHYRTRNPLSPHYGMGTVEAIFRELDADLAQGAHITSFFTNGARISGVLTTSDTVDDREFERVKRQIDEMYGGPTNAYRTLIVDKATDFKPIQPPPASLAVVDLRHLQEDLILMAFGVPKFMLGGREEGGVPKMEQSQYIFYRRMLPRVRRFSERTTLDLTGRWEGRKLVIEPQQDEPPQQRNENAKNKAKAWSSVNEVRRAAGEPEIDDPLYDVPIPPEVHMGDYLALLAAPDDDEADQPPDDGEPAPDDIEDVDDDDATPPEDLEDAEADEQTGARRVRVPRSRKLARGRRALAQRPVQYRTRAGRRGDTVIPFSKAPANPIPQQVVNMAAQPVPLLDQPRIAALASGFDAVSNVERALAMRVAMDVADWAHNIEQQGFVVSVDACMAEAQRRWDQMMGQPVPTLTLLDSTADEIPMIDPTDLDLILPDGYEQRAALIDPGQADYQAARDILQGQARYFHRVTGPMAMRAVTFFNDQRLRVIHRTMELRSQRRAGGTKDPDEMMQRLWDAEAEDQALREWYYAALDAYMPEAMDVPSRIVSATIAWDLTNPVILAKREQLGELIVRINTTTRNAIAEQVEEGMRQGRSIPQIANGVPGEDYRGIQGVFNQATAARAETIARSETAMQYNGAQAVAYRQANVADVQIYDGTGDDVCAAAAGEIWPLQQYEDNPIGHPNCVRTAAPVVR